MSNQLYIQDFGGVCDGSFDDTAALRAAIAAANRLGGATINISGNPRITDTITIDSSFVLTIHGGSMDSKIIFDNSTPNKPLFLLSLVSTHVSFEKITLFDKNTRTSTALKLTGTITAGIANAKNLFSSIRVHNFAIGVLFTSDNPLDGTTHAQTSENTFIHCKFRDCAIAIVNENMQSLNNNFYSTDIENTYTGNEDSIMIKDSAGGGLFFYGGSFISKGRLALLQYPVGASGLWADASLTITGVRFELRATHVGVLIDDDPSSQASGSRFCSIKMINCYIIKQDEATIDLLRFSGRLLASFQGVRVAGQNSKLYIRQFPVSGRTASTGGAHGSVAIDNDCKNIVPVLDTGTTYGSTNTGYTLPMLFESQRGNSDATYVEDAYGFNAAPQFQADILGRGITTSSAKRIIYNDNNILAGFKSQKAVLPNHAQPFNFWVFKNPIAISAAFVWKLYLVKDVADWVAPGTFDVSTDAQLVATTGDTANKSGFINVPIQLTAGWFGGQHLRVGGAGWLEGRIYMELSGSADFFPGMIAVEYF